MRSTLTATILAAFVCSAAEATPAFSGYVENITALYGDSHNSWTDAASARLEGSWTYSDRGGVELHGIVTAALKPVDPFMLLDDSSTINRIVLRALEEGMAGFVDAQDSAMQDEIYSMLEQISSIKRGGLELDPIIRHLPYCTFYPRNSLVLDRALVKLYFRSFDLFIGRQTIGWGTGYAWNPTDIWNRKNPADPTAPKSGVNALRAEIPLGSNAGVSLVISPGSGIDQTSAGGRVKWNLAGYDLSLSLGRMHTDDDALMGLPEKLFFGCDMAGQIGEIGVFAEAAIVKQRYDNERYLSRERIYAQTDAGCYYTFENGLYVMAEYYFNRLGADSPGDYDLRSLLHLLNGDMAGLGRHYGFAGFTKELFDYWNLSFNVLGNITDRSVMLLPSMEYVHSENISVTLGGNIGIGDERRTEFGGPYSNVMLTVTGFF